MNAIRVADLVALVETHSGITTPKIAEHFNVSITYARWAVLQVGTLEFFDGNHVRVKVDQ